MIPEIIKQLEISSNEEEGSEELLDWVREGAAPKAGNYRNFLIAKDGLVIVFDPYQVAPGVMGIISVAVPYALLDRLMAPTSLLGLRGNL